MRFVVEPVPELHGYTIEWAEPQNFYLSRRNRLFHSTTLKPPFKQIATIDAPFWKEAASNFRTAQRVLRFMVTNVVPLENGDMFVTFDKQVGIIREGKFHALKGLVRPCRVLRFGCAVDGKGDVYFGEYLANTERGEMRIYKYKNGDDEIKVVYTFRQNSIRHIHGLYFDQFTNSIFCLTGDAEKECKVLQTFDEFQTIKVVGEGDETWRAVSILFTSDAFFYGTDAEFRANQIFRFDRGSAERTSLAEVNGTVFYSKRLNEDLFFTTTAENAPSQTENVAALWHIGVDGACEKLASFKKDFWHPSIFMFGTIHFPFVNKLENELYFHLVAVENDNQTFRVRSI